MKWGKIFRFKSSILYLVLVLLINVAYTSLPVVHCLHQNLSSADYIAGLVYLVRDFAQREVKHYVIGIMLVAGVLSYVLAAPEIALASVSAFMLGETLDWSIFSFLQRNLVTRLLVSSCISVPIDSIVFLAMVHQLNLAGFLVMNISKWCGILLSFAIWWFVLRNRASYLEVGTA